MPYKVFVAGEEALAADANSYLMSQTVARFTNATQRTSQLTAPALNQLSMRDDRPGAIERWTGSAWVDIATVAELGYAERTTVLAVSQQSEGNPVPVLYAPSITGDGLTVVTVELFMPSVAPAGIAGSAIQFWLYQNSTSIGRIAYVQNPAAGNMIMPVYVRRRLTPPAGAQVYSVGASAVAGDGNIYCGPGGIGQYVPSFIRVARV